MNSFSTMNIHSVESVTVSEFKESTSNPGTGWRELTITDKVGGLITIDLFGTEESTQIKGEA